MDSLESKLIQLNDALIQIALKGKAAIPEAQEASNAAYKVILNSRADRNISVTGSNNDIDDNDIIIINNNNVESCCDNDCESSNDNQNNTIQCSFNTGLFEPKEEDQIDNIYHYTIPATMFYLGIKNNFGPTTIHLPNQSIELNRYPIKIIKLEMGSPIGKRKVTITSDDGALIDNESQLELKVHYESVTLIRHGDDWFTTAHYKN